MTYPDKSNNSVNSLLALLRSAQDGSSSTPSPSPSTSYPISQAAPTQQMPNRPNVPSKRQLDDLLSSLNANSTPKAESPRKTTLIEPFGPVGQCAGPTRSPFDPQAHTTSITNNQSGNTWDAAPASHGRGEGTGTPPRKKRKPSERINEQGYGMMSFGKALPILSELLEDDSFKLELKKMKKEQDTLERRLWAKGEKVKAEHERSIQAEKEIAKIARKVIPPEKKAAWAKSLTSALDTFHLEQCLPAIDGLALRQKQRLIQLGVPGLNEDGEKANERIKRIMELLEAGLEE
ncbi:uncharacterized protein IL334_005563 [Kwoniella shivajii]|uniref:Uncharacterized protein n=1 Tax=Kwoniella shivajii TaxID=564305 RepID=A0ABZ1D5C9_9TREE|nr:hypothetical protein IL334_005563 [Kwoniella shivajii]